MLYFIIGIVAAVIYHLYEIKEVKEGSLDEATFRDNSLFLKITGGAISGFMLWFVIGGIIGYFFAPRVDNVQEYRLSKLPYEDSYIDCYEKYGDLYYLFVSPDIPEKENEVVSTSALTSFAYSYRVSVIVGDYEPKIVKHDIRQPRNWNFFSCDWIIEDHYIEIFIPEAKIEEEE